jgi:hypothetical protein
MHQFSFEKEDIKLLHQIRHYEERKRRRNPVFFYLSESRGPLRGLAMTTRGKIVLNRQN